MLLKTKILNHCYSLHPAKFWWVLTGPKPSFHYQTWWMATAIHSGKVSDIKVTNAWGREDNEPRHIFHWQLGTAQIFHPPLWSEKQREQNQFCLIWCSNFISLPKVHECWKDAGIGGRKGSFLVFLHYFIRSAVLRHHMKCQGVVTWYDYDYDMIWLIWGFHARTVKLETH